jgi:RND superfamily putative drug exporter
VTPLPSPPQRAGQGPYALWFSSGCGESGRAGRIVASGRFPAKPEESVLITAAQGGPLDRCEGRATAADVVRRMKALPEVESVARPVPSPDGTAVLVPVTMKGDTETADLRVPPLLEQSAAVERAHPGLRVEQVGTGSTAKGLGETLGADFKRAEFISLPLTLVIMLVVFKQLGVGLAAAILIDAVVIRIFVLPALMALLGRWNWWPGGPARPGSGHHHATTTDIRHFGPDAADLVR